MKRKKKILWVAGTTVLLIAALSVWTVMRWDAWFSQIDEAPYQAPMQPSRLLLTFGDSTALSRNVSWMCDSVIRPSHLELVCETGNARDTVRIPAIGETFRSRSGVAAYYHAKLRNLNPDSRYSYRVVSGSDSSQWYSFDTRNPDSGRFRFLYVGDVQDSVGGRAPEIFREMFGRFPDAHFLVSGGDFTERPTDSYWAESLGSLDSIGRSVPVLVATGNHDYLKGINLKLERRFSLIFSYFLDSMVGENQVYSLRYGNTEFFLLDSTRGISSLFTQRRWLKSKLEQSTAKWKIVVVHHPLYSLKGKSNNLFVRRMFDSLIRDLGVDLVLQGHEHNYARMTAHRDSEFCEVPTTPVYVVSHCSPKHYRISFDDELYDRYDIAGRYYQMVEVNGDSLTLATYDVRDNRLCDSLKIVKSRGRIEPETLIYDYTSGLKEDMRYEPRPGKKKDLDYKRRIDEYCDRHPQRTIR